jgi:hypothetical protein
MWLKTTRITLLVALLLAVAIVAYLAGHPQIYAGHIGRLVTRHLLREAGWTFACQNLAGNPLNDMRFYGVSMTHDAANGGFSYISCDSLEVEYDLGAILRRNLLFPRIAIYQPQITVKRVASATGAETVDRARGPSIPIHLEEIFVYGAAFDLQQPGQPEAERLDKIGLAASVHSDGRDLHFDLRNLSAAWPSRGIERCRLTAEASLTPGELRVEGATVQLDSTSARIDLHLALPDDGPWLLGISGQAEGFELAPILELLGKKNDLELSASGSATLELGPSTFSLDAVGEGSVAGYPVRATRARMHREGDILHFDELEGEFLGAMGRVHGFIDPVRETLELSGHAENVDLSRPWLPGEEPWPASDLAGEFRMQLELFEGGEFRLGSQTLHGDILGLDVDSLSVDLSAGSAGAEVRRLDAWLYGASVRASGSVTAESVADLNLRASSATAEKLLARFDLPGHASGIEIVGTLRGQLGDPDLSIGAEIDTLRHGKARGARNVVQLEIARLFTRREARAAWVAEELFLGDTQFGRLETSLTWADERLGIEQFALASGDTTVTAKAALAVAGSGAVELELAELRVALGERVWQTTDPSSFTLQPRSWATEGFTLQSDQGSIRARGGVDLDGEVDLELAVKRGDLGLLSWSGLLPLDLEGRVAASVRLSGPATAPELELKLDIDALKAADRLIDRVQLAMQSRGSTLQIERFRVDSDGGNVQLSGDGELERSSWLSDAIADPSTLRPQLESTRLDMQLDAQEFDVSRWVEGFSPSARIALRSHWTGSAKDPRLSGDVEMREYHSEALYIPTMTALLSADADGVRLSEGQLSLPEPWLGFTADLPIRLSANAKPQHLPKHNLQLRLRSNGPTDLAPIATFVAAIEEIEGEFEIDFRAVGDLESPVLSGSLRVEGRHLKVAEMLEEFRELRLEGDFQGGAFQITRATAREGEKGRVSLSGNIPFKQLVPDDLNLELEIHRILLLSVPELRAIVSSNAPLQLELTRPLADGSRVPILRGSVLVDRAIYKGEFGGNGDAGVLGPTSTPPWMADLEIQLRDQVRISNSVAELSLTGDVDFTRDLTGLRLRGLAEISQGSVTIARLLDFDITEGRLDFSRGTELEPAIEITAQTEVPVLSAAGRELELVTVRVRGTFSEPELSFESVTGYDEKTIIKLLAGIPVDSGAEQTQFQELALRMAGNELGRGLAEAIEGIDTVQVETADPGHDPLTGTRIGVGKYLDLADKPLYLRYSQGLSISERDIFLEYQLRRRFLVTFEMRRRLRESVAHTRLNADLKFRVEY